VIVGASTDKVVSSSIIPAGAVLANPASAAALDGVSFRAVGAGNNLARSSAASSGRGAASKPLPARIRRLLR
jgi:hypothetical protein